jgi:protein-S-isoprenylcysteine O-methyltransferase Ste14
MEALERRAWGGVVKFAVALALLIFVPAWTIRFWQAWVYWMVFSAAVAVITSHFVRHDPALIERRLAAGPAAERERSQQRIQAAASVMLCAVFVVAGFDHRSGWSAGLDAGITAAADLLVAIAFALIFVTFRENSHASAVVEVGSGQRVISTGPYGVVRHPMYSGAVLLFLATPLAPGSLWAYLPAIGLSAAVVARLLDEERYLCEHLPGYREYRLRVRFRLVPGVW